MATEGWSDGLLTRRRRVGGRRSARRTTVVTAVGALEPIEGTSSHRLPIPGWRKDFESWYSLVVDLASLLTQNVRQK